MKKKMNRGFTLLELMIVVVMVAILAAVTVPKMMQVSSRNKLGEVTNLFQETMAEARALAMKTRQAVVVEVRSNQLWVNMLAGTECNGPIENDGAADTKRCIQLIDSLGSNVVNLALPEYTNAGVAMCDIRVAVLDAGACSTENITIGDAFALCYNGTGQLWARTDPDKATNTACGDSSAPDPDAGWQKTCVPWIGANATVSATQGTWFSGADVRFNRFTAGSGSCASGGLDSAAPTGSEDITRRVIVPAGGHPIVKLVSPND
ncbi:MAG: type II secretion system protein [Deltaproteobacteria bacterium]|nr:type II secretion system protein [Deltaproteobacteria bacterium]MBN2673318.1 type II secretion system protein [Deltaproteobacteria bacterium]